MLRSSNTLTHLINDLDFQFDVIAVSETWNPEEKNNLFTPGQIENYQPYEGITGSSMKGGCCFYVKNTICFIPRSDLDKSYKDNQCEFDCKWIEIVNKHKDPRHKDDKYLNYLKQTFKKIRKENIKVIITGDFNNLLKHETSKDISDFLNYEEVSSFPSG